MHLHHRLHAGAAHLVDRRARRATVEAGAKHRLARRSLALASGEHAAEHGIVHFAGIQASTLNGGTHGGGAKTGGADILEVADEATHRGAGGADYDNGIVHLGYL
ncbi:hypothetical protein D9M71_528430 [compost metagenome]